MALARLAFRNLQQIWSTTSTTTVRSASSSTCLLGLNNGGQRSVIQGAKWSEEFMKRFMASSSSSSTTTTSGSEGYKTAESTKEVSVQEGGKKSGGGLFHRKKKGKGGGLFSWRRRDHDFVRALWEYFPSGLGNALMQATENINRLFESMNISPFRVKEEDKRYQLRYEVPGLSKDDVKITIDDGVLTIVGELEREEKQGSPSSSDEDDDGRRHWSAKTHGFYNASVLLPDDAKVDEIKAELKDGLLTITIPSTEKPKKDVKEVKVA